MLNVLVPAFGRPKLKVGFAALLLLPFATSSHANTTTTTTFGVQVTFAASCIINSASTLNFGSPGVLTANTDQTSTIAVQCTNTTPYNIGLDAGAGSGATMAARKMTSGSATVTYSLYTDSSRIDGMGQHRRHRHGYWDGQRLLAEHYGVRPRSGAIDAGARHLHRHRHGNRHVLIRAHGAARTGRMSPAADTIQLIVLAVGAMRQPFPWASD